MTIDEAVTTAWREMGISEECIAQAQADSSIKYLGSNAWGLETVPAGHERELIEACKAAYNFPKPARDALLAAGNEMLAHDAKKN